MPEKQLLLSSAKSGVLVEEKHPWFHLSPQRLAWGKLLVLAIGVAAIVVGAADVATRLSRLFDGRIGVIAFAPAIVALDPTLVAQFASVSDAPITPTRLTVPALGVDAAVEEVGKREDGAMGTPQDINNVAWYKLGQRPGQSGNAVFAGHVNDALTTAGVFARLAELRIGDTVQVFDEAGKTLIFMVVSTTVYPTNEAPLDDIFITEGPSGLVLITCEGDWIPSERSFNKRLVVVARLLAS